MRIEKIWFFKSYDTRNVFVESISITNIEFELGCYDILSNDYNNKKLSILTFAPMIMT